MEYISKQSLLADLNEATPRSYFAFETMVREYPTEDVAPVVHAHWELYEDGWYCTNCELYAPFDCDPEEKGVPYCPNCGAKMDEVAE